MMNETKWDLFQSGIYSGHVRLSERGLVIALTDPFTGVEEKEKPADDALIARARGLTKINFGVLEDTIREMRPVIERDSEGDLPVGTAVTLHSGRRYEKKDEHHYIERNMKFPLDLIVDGGQIVGVQTPGRESESILIDPTKKALTILPEWEKSFPGPVCTVKEKETVMIPMRDGIRLAADIWLPRGKEGPFPCVLVRTPYGRQDTAPGYLRFVQRGYALVIQDVRGRNDSEGEWIPQNCETEDGSDTLDYLAACDWCSGNIGMIGGSYLGYVQWAAAASGNPHLKAMISEVTAGSAFVDIPRRGGTLVSGTLAWAFAVSSRRMDASKMVRDDWDEVLSFRPLSDVCTHALGYRVPFWEEWLRHDCNDDFWKKGDWYNRAKEAGGVQVPALIFSGWFDDDGMGTTQALDLTAEYPEGRRKVLLGPWKHSGNADYDLHGVPMGSNAVRYDIDLLFFRWFEKYLCGVENGVADGAPVEYFTVGENRWKTAENWPPENTKTRMLYLGGGDALTRFGGGTLLTRKPDAPGSDTFRYDPKCPARNIIDMSENELEVPEDYTKEEERGDFLCYTTDPLEEDVTVTGDARVKLYVSGSAPDTDLVVRLTKVGQDGKSIKLADGLLNLKYRNGFDEAEFLSPGEVYPVEIRTTKISCLFRKGERLRLTITSSAVGFIFPCSNTKEGFRSDKTQIADNTIWKGGDYPSGVELRTEQ